MSMLSIRDFTYRHANQELLFENINLQIGKEQKVALIGRNGVGKSCLLRAIKDYNTYPAIEVAADPYYVPQDQSAYANETVASVLAVDGKLHALHSILNGKTDEVLFETLNDEWDIEARIELALSYWGLKIEVLNTPMKLLSGGERVKVFLSGMLFHDPPFIILDEPTNHLDASTREKFYQWLEGTKATVLLVSHDRTSLRLLTHIYELYSNQAVAYSGNYDAYLQQKEEENEALLRRLENQKSEWRKAQKTRQEVMERRQRIDARGKGQTAKKSLPTIIANDRKNKAARTTASLGGKHEKKLEAMNEEIRRLSETVDKTKSLKIQLADSQLHQGRILIEMIQINFSYKTKPLWNMGITTTIHSGDRMLIKGSNGSGKTTFIKLAVDQLANKEGHIRRNDFNYLYLDQDYSLIDVHKTVYEQAQSYNVDMPEHEVKMHLARSLFAPDSWSTPCTALSGGEKMKLSLCFLLITRQTPDVFILDEPTNNLDLESIQVLTSSVQGYAGTLLLVSHDASFVEEVNVNKEINLDDYLSD